MDRTGNILDKTSVQTTTESAVPYWKQESSSASETPTTASPEPLTTMNSYASTASEQKSHVAPASQSKPAASRFGGTLLTVLILVVAVIAGMFVWRKLPRTYQACSTFIGSKTADGRCTTFYNKVFVDWPGDGASNDTSVSLDAVLTQTATDSATPTPTLVAQSVTKGGVPLSPTPTTKPTTPKPTNAPAATATQAPAEGGNWIKHNYPGQNLSVHVPRNYRGSDATRNRDTQVTTFKLWTTNANNPEVAFKLQPSSTASDEDKNKQANTSVAGNPANKVTSGATTTFTWQKNDVFYTATCTTEAKLCDEIMGKVEVK